MHGFLSHAARLAHGVFCTSVLHLQNIQASENHAVGMLEGMPLRCPRFVAVKEAQFLSMSDSPQAVLLPSLKLLR